MPPSLLRKSAAILLLLLCLSASAEPLVKPSPGKLAGSVSSDVLGNRWLVFGPNGAVACKAHRLYTADAAGKLTESGSQCDFEVDVAGRYTVVQIPADDNADLVQVSVRLGGLTPEPPGPNPPTPPGPEPPVPPQPPAPSWKVAGFSVVIFEEASQRAALTPGQQETLFGKTVSEYLNRKCVLGADGKTPQWRIFDQHSSLALESSVFSEAGKLRGPTVPWIVIGNATASESVALPGTLPEIMALLKKYGGE